MTAGSAKDTGSPHGHVGAGTFRTLMEAFQAIRVPLSGTDAHAAEARRRAEIRAMIEGEFSDQTWRNLMAQAQDAAERGEHESLLMRFPARQCSDHGRAIIQKEPGWPDTLTGDAASLYHHWRDDVRRQGFQLEARVLDFPGGLPGDVALFLTWRTAPGGASHMETPR